MTPTGIWVFTPYGKGEVLGTRNDGIIVVQLRTSLDKPYLGYFHLSQVRQLGAGGGGPNNNGGDQNDAAMEDMNNNGPARVCGSKRGALDEGEQAAQRVRGPELMPFTDLGNQMQH